MSTKNYVTFNIFKNVEDIAHKLYQIDKSNKLKRVLTPTDSNSFKMLSSQLI